MHPLIQYINKEDNYLVFKNEKLDNFKDKLRAKYIDPPVRIKLLENVNLDHKMFIKEIEFKTLKQRKKYGVPKKLPALTPEKKMDIAVVRDLVNRLKKAKSKTE